VEVRSLADAESFVTADGSTIRELFGLPTGGVEHQSVAEATLAPGQATQRHYHRASEEVYFVLDGERRRVSPGDAIAIPPGAWHELQAEGDRPLRILCCCVPPYRHEDTFFE